MTAHLGIRYARAARFERPEPVAWSESGAFGPSCPQTQPPFRAAPVGEQGEDCLHLNVWTPSPDGSRPVLVWIHGGNFLWGSTADPQTSGHRLAERGDVVVVSIGHRVGALGFLGPENLGLLDLVAGLEWVRDNIAAFGGDPGRVTLFGVSSGGMKAAALHAMPAARGLFHGIASQSGPGLRALTPDQGDRARQAFLDALDGDARTVSIERLLDAQARVTGGSPVDGGVELGPVLGDVLPVHPVDAPPTVPWLVGTNRDELAGLLATDPRYASYGSAVTEADALDRLARLTPEADRLLATYREQHPRRTPASLLSLVLSDRMRLSAITLAERMGGWMYLFAEGDAIHGAEVPYVFGHVDSPVSTAMGDAWVALARDGDPGWAPYADGRATMVFGGSPEVVLDPGGAERVVLTELGLGW